MTTTMTAETPSKGLHYGLWVVQALAAVAFLGAGMMKATKPLAELAANMAWVPHFPRWRCGPSGWPRCWARWASCCRRRCG